MTELSERQEELLHYLPASGPELADRLGVGKSTVRDHIAEIRRKGIDLPYDRGNQVYASPDSPKMRRVSTKNTGQKTREANDFVTAVEETVLRRLQGSEQPIAPQDTDPGNEDMVLHVTDLHIGDVVEDQRGNVIYDTDISIDVMDHITQKALDLRNLMGNIAEFDTIHVLYGGDNITNENIYDGQAYDIEKMLADQMTQAVNVMTRQLKSFAEHFETVNVICQPGNHGKTRASGVSKQANMDLVCYRWVDDRIRESPYDNINFTTSEAAWFRTFALRGGKWKGFLTHGQDSLEHIGTSAGRNKWRGWLNEQGFDVGYRGHYHESKREPIQNGPMIYESPSPKPADEWTSRIGKGSIEPPHKRLATVHGSSDTRPVTWEFVIDDSGMSED
jgi:HTH domain.